MAIISKRNVNIQAPNSLTRADTSAIDRETMIQKSKMLTSAVQAATSAVMATSATVNAMDEQAKAQGIEAANSGEETVFTGLFSKTANDAYKDQRLQNKMIEKSSDILTTVQKQIDQDNKQNNTALNLSTMSDDNLRLYVNSVIDSQFLNDDIGTNGNDLIRKYKQSMFSMIKKEQGVARIRDVSAELDKSVSNILITSLADGTDPVVSFKNYMFGETVKDEYGNDRIGKDGKPLKIGGEYYNYVKMLGGSRSAADSAIITSLAQQAINQEGTVSGFRTASNISKIINGIQDEFDGVNNFERIKGQVQKNASSKQLSARRQSESKFVNDFYSLLVTGGFTSKDEANKAVLAGENARRADEFQINGIDGQTAYQLYQKINSHYKDREASTALDEAYRVKDYGFFNTAKQSQVDAYFDDKVTGGIRIVPEQYNTEQKNVLGKWLEGGFKLPSSLEKWGNRDVNNGSYKELSDMVRFYQDMKIRSGNAVYRVFSDDNIAKMNIFLRTLEGQPIEAAQNTMTQIKTELDNFDRAKIPDANGVSLQQKIRQELKDEDRIKFFSKEASDSSLNPNWFNWGSADALAQEYAMDYLTNTYTTYRLGKMLPKEAQERAKQVFRQKHTWVKYPSGNSVYIPNEFGTGVADSQNFSNNATSSSDLLTRLNGFLSSNKIAERIAVQTGDDVETVRNGLEARPDTDYSATRRLNVYYKGIPTSYWFNKNDFDIGVKNWDDQITEDRLNKAVNDRKARIEAMKNIMRYPAPDVFIH